jgi:hypothetical protein
MTQATSVRQRFLNLAQAADRLGLSIFDTEDLVRRNALEARIFITVESVDEYLAAHDG